MSIPQHENPKSNREAVAPYNFVPLPASIRTMAAPPSHDRYHLDLLTGKLVCTLTTASPLYVRASQTLAQFQADETPSDPYYGERKLDLQIPGSSLRGMLRNMVEIVSQSKLNPVTDKPLFFRTVEKSSIGDAYGKRMTQGDPQEGGWYPKANAGYLELIDGDYFIRPAQEILGTQHYRVEEDVARGAIRRLRDMAFQRPNGRWSPERGYKWLRQQVWFKPTKPKGHLPRSPQFYAEIKEIRTGGKPEGQGWKRGWFVASGWVPARRGRGKHLHWIVGPPVIDDQQLIEISDDDMDLYKEYGGGTSQKIRREKMSVVPDLPNKPIPCFYTFWKDEEANQRVAFGHTGMFRLPYEQSPAQMLPPQLRDAGLDLAEAMFGMIDAKRGAHAGRVFVTDAKFVGDPRQALMPLQTISTQALSSPKPTSFQHYLTQKNSNNPNALSHYDSSTRETVLRGHKLFWHVGNTDAVKSRLDSSPEIRGNDDRSQFRPIKEGQSFTFNIHFENLRAEELGALLWVLDKAADPKYQLKLGMGKPYGLGSIGLTYQTALTNREARYDDLFDGDSWQSGRVADTTQIDQLEKARTQFARWVLANDEASKDDVDQNARIQEFLTMLSWEDRPSPNQTRYMILNEFTGRISVQTGQQGRFSKRPVLPKPTQVVKAPQSGSRSTTQSQRGQQSRHGQVRSGASTQSRQPNRPVEHAQRQAVVPVVLASLPSAERDLKKGMVFSAKVVKTALKYVSLKIAEDSTLGKLEIKNLLPGFDVPDVGSEIYVQITGKKKGKVKGGNWALKQVSI